MHEQSGQSLLWRQNKGSLDHTMWFPQTRPDCTQRAINLVSAYVDKSAFPPNCYSTISLKPLSKIKVPKDISFCKRLTDLKWNDQREILQLDESQNQNWYLLRKY